DTDAQKAKRAQAMEKARHGYLEMIEAQAASAFHPASLANERLMSARRKMVCEYGVERFLAHTQAVMQRPDRRALMTGVPPTLVLCAGHDTVYPPSLIRACADEIPGAAFVCVQDAGHRAPMEKPV